jgi:apolipoprotein N-acyltransferase
MQISHKSILVSGVEKFPFEKYFAFLKKFTLDLGGTNGSLAAAKEATGFTTEDGVKIGPVICFESAFGEHAADLVKRGAQLLVVITNDGWWRDSSGSWQHFGYSRIRAIETRKNIIRSANTGISGFINSRGDVMKKSEINSCVVLSSTVHLNNQITFYTKYGDFIGWVCLSLSGLILINFLIRKLRWIDRKGFHI